ncbi:unnamed protein product, partial [Laminaria digitata]
KDRATGKEQSVKIESSSGLSSADIERMVENAEAHAKEDEARRAKVEIKNGLDQLVYQVEKTLGEAKDNLPMELGRDVAEALEGAKQALKQDDEAAWTAAQERLTAASAKMAEKMYAESTPPQGEAPAPKAKAEEGEDVIDAEFTEAA